jgi:hypothetical protein
VKTREMRSLLRFWVPYGLVEMRRGALAKRQADAQRVETIARISQLELRSPALAPTFDFEAGVRFLASRGLDESQIRAGSIPETSLDFVARKIAAEGWGNRTLIGLHIGNFVGLSLAAFIKMLTVVNSGSLVVAVDPNVPHRGIVSPQDYVLALLTHFGLQSNALVVAGYSERKSVSNDGIVFDGYDPAENFLQEAACENVIANLGSALGHCMDVAVVDGNHQASYLRHEVDELARVLRLGGLLVLDDVDKWWPELRDVYLSLPKSQWEDLGSDGRVALLRLRATGSN